MNQWANNYAEGLCYYQSIDQSIILFQNLFVSFSSFLYVFYVKFCRCQMAPISVGM